MPDAVGNEGNEGNEGGESVDPSTDLAGEDDEQAAPTVASVSAELDAAQAALEQANARAEAEADRALRAAAEAENARKRADRSIENARKYALEGFVKALLPAVDSFDQAAEAAAGADAPPAFAEGVRLSLKLLVEALERHGVEVVDPIGAPFDPAVHEAMSVVENAAAEPDSVTQVFQKGYTLNGRLVRPARVIVSRAPPPAAAETDTDANAAEDTAGP